MALVERRARGALEQAVLAHLWAASGPQTPAEVLAATGGGLAYTTVLTILSRLHAKGLVTREARGRAHAYRPVLMEPAMAAARMAELLSHSADRGETLAGLVAALGEQDCAAVQAALSSPPSPATGEVPIVVIDPGAGPSSAA